MTERHDPPWLVLAQKYVGEKEIPGRKHNPKIIQFWKDLSLSYRDDETPWCAGFVGAMLEQTGFRSTRSAGSRSYSNWKDGIKLSKPVRGCVVVFWRGSPKSWKGHVGFVVSKDKSGRINVLGGNQSNAVNVKPFTTNRVVGYYWPKDYPVPDEELMLEGSYGKTSTNEA